MSNKDLKTNSKLKIENVKLDKKENSNLKQFLQSKKGQYSLISVLVLGVLLVSGLFTYNLLKPSNIDTAKAGFTSNVNIVQTAQNTPGFTSLVSALQAADLVTTLSGPGPFTVFAPTDAAFAKLPPATLNALLTDPAQKAALTKILTYHVVSGSVNAATVVTLPSARTVEGNDIRITVKNGNVFLNDTVQVITTDIITTNGIIHVLDTVLSVPTSTTFSNGKVTVDKKYVSNNGEADTTSIPQGGLTTVRLRYSNSGDTSITDATIKDTIPANFTYVPGTFKNCLNPTSSETVCDTLTAANKDTAFTTLTSANGVSPAAGLYDGASVANTAGGTAPTSTSGLLGIGKKRYLNLNQCLYDGGDWLTTIITSPTAGRNVGSTGTNFSNTAQTTSNCLTGNAFNLLNTTESGIIPFDSLGKRYLNLNQCLYDGGDWLTTIITSPTAGRNVGSTGTNFSNTAQTTSNCLTGNAFNLLNTTESGIIPLDSLDTTRSSGYIEYQLQSANNIAVGTYGTTVGLSSTSTAFTALTDGGSTGGNGITITAAPAPSVSSNKLYSTDGINWSSTVTATTGQEVFVRLLRDNTGTASASDVNQKDTLPSPFTYVPGTFKNCLSPSITNITDTTPNISELACDTLTATNKDTALTKLTSNTGISPVAGLYDAADTTANGTAISSATGLMEIGKKRYVHMQECQYANPSTGDTIDQNIISSTQPNGAFEANNNSTRAASCSPAPAILSLDGGVSAVADTLGKRYVHMQECQYANPSTGDTINQNIISSTQPNGAFEANNNSTRAASCSPAPAILSLDGGVSAVADTLGKRYVHMQECQYANPSTGDTINQNIISSTQPNGAFEANNNSTRAASCSPAPAILSLDGGVSAVADLLDSTRAKAFIEYKMVTPTNATAGTYGTTSTLSSANVSNTFSQTSGATGTGINLIYPDFTTTDIPGLTLTCGVGGTPGTVTVNSTTTCTFTLPPNKALPSTFKLGIGDGTPAGNCTVTNTTTGLVTCINVPTGTLLGTQPVNGQIGSDTITPTGETVTVISGSCTTQNPCALFDTALTYSPTQALAKRYGGSGSTTADNLILTLKDTRLEQPTYTTTCTFRYKFKSDTTWRNLASTVAYNNTTGCSSTLLKADQLFWNVDFEITAVTTSGSTTKNYLLYSNYDFKAGSIGVTSIGGSGL